MNNVKRSKPKVKHHIKKVSKTVSLNKIPKGNFKKWLIAGMERRSIPLEKRRITEYTHIYNRAKQMMPQMVDFVETIFKKRKAGRLNSQLVFLGRGSRPFYQIAYRLGPGMRVQTKNIKLIEAGRRLTGKIYSDPRIRKQLLKYMETQGIDTNKPITFVDTGVIGTVPNDLVQLFKMERPKTKANGFMFYGRNIRFENIHQYSPAKGVDWKLPHLSEREARSIIEELPKSVLTIKKLLSEDEKVKPEYIKSETEEALGASVVRKAIMDALAVYIKE